ncbi:MAG: endonuclease III domain-containing protein [Deltaproteobacteria bacterium]|nr:endonuclease III domain-containing protein [Deltaproteobacteria bacterium]
MRRTSAEARLLRIYDILNGHFGDLHWWPAETAFEVALGAILTQNTNWKNVEAAMHRLKGRKMLDVEAIYRADPDDLAELIRPAGYYNVKTKRVKAFVIFLRDGYGGSIENMFAEDLPLLRSKLLAVHGIGPETADSILLYAGGKPVFVVDAYTRRILERHGMINGSESYEAIQRFCMDALPPDVSVYNQFHALLVHTAKLFCRVRARCLGCPLNGEEVL